METLTAETWAQACSQLCQGWQVLRHTGVTISNWNWWEDPAAAELEMALSCVFTSVPDKQCGSRFSLMHSISVGVDRMQRNFATIGKHAAD
jgi:hypothetical protein